MRDYALKREGLHHWMVTDEESRAYLDALRRLAGLSVLTMPWPASPYSSPPRRIAGCSGAG
jgi:hypothetical protein